MPRRSVYFIAALIVNNREQILKLDCDMPSVHRFLQDEVLKSLNLENTCLVRITDSPPGDNFTSLTPMPHHSTTIFACNY